jgi:homoserine acetyltransferase
VHGYGKKPPALDPNKFFIIIPNMFGNGLSSSPSNTPEPYNGPRFPQVTACDMVYKSLPTRQRLLRALSNRPCGRRPVDTDHSLIRA